MELQLELKRTELEQKRIDAETENRRREAETELESKLIQAEARARELQNERERREHELRMAEAGMSEGMSEVAMMTRMWTRTQMSGGAHEWNPDVHGWKPWQIA